MKKIKNLRVDYSGDLIDIHTLKEEYFQINDYKSYAKISAPMIA